MQIPNVQSVKMISVDIELTSSTTFIEKYIYVHPTKGKIRDIKNTEQGNRVRIISHSHHL